MYRALKDTCQKTENVKVRKQKYGRPLTYTNLPSVNYGLPFSTTNLPSVNYGIPLTNKYLRSVNYGFLS